MRQYFILNTVLIVFINISTASNQTIFNRIYNLTSGLYEAIEINVLNSTVHKLIGVPYSNIPKSFDKPTQIKKSSIFNSNSVKKADKYKAICVQPILFNHGFYGNFKLPHEYEMTLDCLSINLFLPKKLQNKGKLLTAMLFIHGGSNAAGTSSFIDASALASEGNVIVASPNYRLDVLGFLNINQNNETTRIKGNNGLWDLILSLEWLYNNCEVLGCNKSSITVFGHSAGSSDTMLLAMSKQGRKYINRIIMQSGSGLAHWAFSYENHLYKEIIKYVNSKNKNHSLKSQEVRNLISLTGYDKSRYVSSLNDTFNNFITHTTCNLTLKSECLKEKIKNFYRVFPIEDSSIESSQIVLKLKEMFNSLDLREVISVFNYFHNELMINNIFKASSNFNSFEYILNSEIKEHNIEKNFNDTEYRQLLNRINPDFEFDLTDSDKFKTHPCYSDLFLFIWVPGNLQLACDFIISFDFTNQLKREHNTFLVSLIEYFLSCYKHYYKKSEQQFVYVNSNIFDLILSQNIDLVIDEMKICIEQSNHFTLEEKLKYLEDKSKQSHAKRSNKKISVYNDNRIANTILEFSFLTANANYLHRPNMDLDLIEKMPHDYINELPDGEKRSIDTLLGINSDESFYFLLHDYNINHLITHTFIYSSLLNLTENLLYKLARINTNMDLNACLRKELFSYYNISLDEKQLFGNSLKEILNSIPLLSDYDFILPVISELKALMRKESKLNYYVYEFSFVPSFNYLLDFMKDVYNSFETATKYYENNVVPHFTELDFVFGMPMLSKSNLIKFKDNNKYYFNYTQLEYDLSTLMIKYWSNFAKYGDPNKDGVSDEVKWNRFTNLFPNILKIDSDKPKTNTQLIKTWLKKHEFWYETLTNQIYETCSKKYDKSRDKAETLDDMLKFNLNYFNNIYNFSENSKLILNYFNFISILFFNFFFYFFLF